MAVAVEVKNLVTRFYAEDGVVHALRDLYGLEEVGTIGIVGESGCGKNAHALLIMRLIPNLSGKIEWRGVIRRARPAAAE